MKFRFKKIFFLIFFIFLIFFVSWNFNKLNNKNLIGQSLNSLESLNYEKVCFKEKCFDVEIADSPEEREQGLMLREAKDFGENQGMLFIFKNIGVYPFWMKNTLIPLDIIWISKDKEILKVVSIANNVKPCKDNILTSCEVYTPDEKALYVLEVNAGSAEKYGIKVGEEVERM